MRKRKLILTGVVTTLFVGSVGALSLVAGPASAATAYSVAPYVDMSAASAGMLDNAISQTGLTSYTAAFIIGSGCTPIWGDTLGIENSTVNARIARAQSAGARTIISFGGAGGVELGQSCTDVNSLTQAYQSVINKYHVDHLDFDIEGAAIADPGSVNRRFQAIRNLQNNNGGLRISLTIPVLESGPDGNGTNFLRSAKDNGVNVDIINAMTMDYGHPVGDMAAAAKSAADGTLAAARGVGLNVGYGNIGITPMIGNNDSGGEVVTQDNARDIVNWANSKGIGRLAFWSIGRDQPCPGGGVSANCSGLGGNSLDFTRIFNSFGGGGGNPGGQNQLTAGQRLVRGQELVSSNGRFHLVMQTDGNLVIYDGTPGAHPRWATGTWNLPDDRRPTHADMQGDGNLVLYNDANQAAWAAGVFGANFANPYLEMQDDGNLVIYHNGRTPVWASGTQG
jgi:chitinase